MGLWEFLRQWRPSRIGVGIAASIFFHLALVAMVLWGPKLVARSKWDVKKGDSLIVELPKPEEPAPSGIPSAPPSPPAAAPSPPARPTPPAPPVAAPKPSPSVAPRPAPVPEERRVASTPRPPAPSPPTPKAAEPAPSLLKATEPTPTPSEPTPKAAEPASAPAAPPSVPAAPPRPSPEQQVASLPPGGAPQAPPVPDMRTALRRGGGGTGQGRGGIEGEPIPLDSDNPRFNDYLEQVRRRIKEKWGYPCVVKDGGRNCEYKTASLDVQFGILKDGRVQFVEVVRQSDYAIYDEYAVTAIKLAGPFPPVPPEMMRQMRAGSTGVPINARFMYVMESSLTKLLR